MLNDVDGARHMTADEFLAQIQPARRRSKLEPWLADLVRLRQAGCTFDQLRQFLAQNQIHISRAAIAAYLARVSSAIAAKSAPDGKPYSSPDRVRLSEAQPASDKADTLGRRQQPASTGGAALPADWLTAKLTRDQMRLLTHDQQLARREAILEETFPNPLKGAFAQDTPA
jgi:hypothetical protein